MVLELAIKINKSLVIMNKLQRITLYYTTKLKVP